MYHLLAGKTRLPATEREQPAFVPKQGISNALIGNQPAYGDGWFKSFATIADFWSTAAAQAQHAQVT
ncbi:MAG: hypothetical protein WB580_05125 [Candidatus Binataceae bacterium]